MIDVAHQFGSDLSISPSGDIATSSGTQLTQDRLLRRLLTNPGAYIWRLGYGAGLGRFVGRPAASKRIQALARSQTLKERAVARSPIPTATVASTPDGVVQLTLTYGDVGTDLTQTLSVAVL